MPTCRNNVFKVQWFDARFYTDVPAIQLGLEGYIKWYSNGKAIPFQAWTGPECSTKLRLPHFKTTGT
jgi:hypothetical protein